MPVPDLDPQMAAALARSETLAPSLGAVAEVPLAETRRHYRAERRFWNEDGPDLPSVVDDKIAGPAGEVRIRRYYPADARPLPGLIFAHGGGFVMGDLDTHDRVMRSLARASGAAVVGIDYSLSPERRYPIAIEECLVLLEALAGRGEDWGIDRARLAMGGDSAGAHLTMACALSAPGRLRGCLLYYGPFGLRDSLSRRLFAGDGMSRDDMEFYYRCYLGDQAPDESDPRLNPLAADLSGLPPLFVAAAELDPLRDDSLALAALAERHRVRQRLEIYPGMPHGFLHYGRMVDIARRALEDGGAFLRGVLN